MKKIKYQKNKKERNIPVNGKKIIPSLTYDAMFKAVLDNNPILLDKLVGAIIKHCKLAITETKELELLRNELNLHKKTSKKLTCDYLIKVNNSLDINLELNRYYYEEQPNRNLDYAFTIYSRHFKAKSNYLEYGKYNIIQINFNNYPNPFRDKYFPYMLVNPEKPYYMLSDNFRIINVDIESCFKSVYNNINHEEISDLDRLAALIYCESIEEVDNVLGDVFNMKEKNKILNSIENISNDKNTLEDIKMEDDIEYRYAICEDRALERGIKQGIEQEKIELIKNMINENVSIDFISKVTGKSVSEIEEIKSSI